MREQNADGMRLKIVKFMRHVFGFGSCEAYQLSQYQYNSR